MAQYDNHGAQVGHNHGSITNNFNSISAAPGLDLSSALSEKITIGDNFSMPVTINVGNAPDFAWTVYRMCEKSTSQSISGVSRTVSDLHIALRTLKDKLESDRFSVDYRDLIQDLAGTCCADLQRLQSLLGDFASLPYQARETWDRMDFESQNASQISNNLRSSVKVANEINQKLAEHSMNELIARLDELLEDIQSGARSTSSMSSDISALSRSTSAEGEQVWQDLHRTLEGFGLSPQVISQQRDYIVEMLLWKLEQDRTQLILPVSNSASMVGVPDRALENHATNASQLHDLGPANPSKRKLPSWIKQIQYTLNSRENLLLRSVKERDVAAVREILRFRASLCEDQNGANAIDIAISNEDEQILSLLMQRCRFTDLNASLRLDQQVDAVISHHQDRLLQVFLDNGFALRLCHMLAACRSGNLTAAKLYFQDGRPVMYKHSGFLSEAAYHNHPEIFALLLQHGANVKVKVPDCGLGLTAADLTALHVASAACNAAIVELALLHGADPGAHDYQGGTPLHKVPCDVYGLREASRGYIDDEDDNVDNKIAQNGPTMRTAFPSMREPSGDPGAVIKVLLKNGAISGAQNNDGQTALHFAARHNDVSSIKALLLTDTLIDVADRRGNSPLHHATSPKNLCRRRYCTQINLAPLVSGVRTRRVNFGGEAAMNMLLTHGAQVDRRNFLSRAPLHLASSGWDLERVELLLKYGADVNAQDNRFFTPLHHGVAARALEIIKLLLARGANTNMEAIVQVAIGDGFDEQLMTPFQYAKHLKFEDVLHLLEQSITR